MFSRVVTITGAQDIDAGIEYVRSTVAPVLHQQKGFRGTTASVDRSNDLFGVLSLWESAADRDASDSALLKLREEATEIVGGPPVAGSSLFVTRVRSDIAKIDKNLEYFKREVLPQIKAGPGLLTVRQMVNRETGEGLVGTTWSDHASMRAAVEAAIERQRATDLPVTIVSRSEREIVLVDFP